MVCVTDAMLERPWYTNTYINVHTFYMHALTPISTGKLLK